MASPPGIKGEPGLAGLSGNPIDVFMIFIHFSIFIFKGLPGLQGPPGK